MEAMRIFKPTFSGREEEVKPWEHPNRKLLLGLLQEGRKGMLAISDNEEYYDILENLEKKNVSGTRKKKKP